MAEPGVNRLIYKKLHEEFVSGHNGTTTWEITLVASAAPISVLLRNVLLGVICLYKPSLSDGWRTIIDFCCLILPVFMCITILADYVNLILMTVLIIAAILVLIGHQRNQTQSSDTKDKNTYKYILDLAIIGKKPFVTNFRSFANIATAICILAVDFVIFPRRFCKTETYGTGLMDIAVGGFVVANAIVSPEARGKYPIRRTIGQRLDGILRACKSTVPLWILGMCRVAAVKGVDYHEHVSEYGVHWNFFFTLALVKILSSFVLSIFDPSLSWLIAIAISSGYEYLLSGLGYRTYVLHGDDGLNSRRTLLEANREGIFSCLGYCAVVFASSQLGTFLWQPRSKLREWVSCAALLILADIVLWLLLAYIEAHVVHTSRRMANLPYQLWTMAYCLHSLACFLVVDIICFILQETGTVAAVLNNRSPNTRLTPSTCLLEAINRNALFYFLLANLLTGSINLSMQTITAPPSTGMVAVLLYMLVLSLVTVFLHKRNITIKFW